MFAGSRHAVCRLLCLVMHAHGWLRHVGTTACMLSVAAPAGACCRMDSGAGSLAEFEAVLTELFPIPSHHAALVHGKLYKLFIYQALPGLQATAGDCGTAGR